MIEAAGWELRRQAGLRVPTFVYETDAFDEDLRELEHQFLLPAVAVDAEDLPVFELLAPDQQRSLGRIGPFSLAQVERLDAAQRDLGACLVLIATRDGQRVFSPRAFCADLLLDFSGELARAEDLVRRTRHAEAIRKLQALVRSDGTPLGVHLQIGRIALAQGDPDGAAQAAERELHIATRASGELLPAASRALFLLAQVEEERGRPDEALRAYSRLFGLRPNHVGALVTAGVLLVGQGAAEDGYTLLARAQACLPESPLLDSARVQVAALGGISTLALEAELARRAEAVDLAKGVALGAPDPAPLEATGEASGASGERVYRILCYVAHCDGEVAPAERILLDEYRERLGIDPQRATSLEEEGSRAANLLVGPSKLEQELILRGMIDMAAADGRLAPAELRDLRAIGLQLGLSEDELARRLGAVFSGRVPTDLARAPALEPSSRVLHTLPTAAGDLTLLDAPPELVQRLSALWPLGLGRDEEEEGLHSLPLARGEDDVATLLLRQAAADHARAAGCVLVNRIRIAFGAGFYRRIGYGGLLLPMSVLLPLPDGDFEPGVAFVAIPASTGPEGAAVRDEDFVDRHLGPGSSAMVGAMLAGLGPKADRVGFLPLAAPQGLDAQARLDGHMLWADLAILGDAVLCLRSEIDPSLPIWEALVLGGIQQAYHLPCAPAWLT